MTAKEKIEILTKKPSDRIEEIFTKEYYSQGNDDQRGQQEVWRDSIIQYLDELHNQGRI